MSLRILFFSAKGGLGRTTALAATAWALAQQGKKVVAVDLCIESSGLPFLLKPDTPPVCGVVDWLADESVDLHALFAKSTFDVTGSIYVVPACGTSTTLANVLAFGKRPSHAKIEQLIRTIERELAPDVVLIDAPSGFGALPFICDFECDLVLLFSDKTEQTWRVYRDLIATVKNDPNLFEIRERLQIVAALVPDDREQFDYFDTITDKACDLFAEIYDELGPGEIGWNYAFDDPDAPHYPIPVLWSRRWFHFSNFADLVSPHKMIKLKDIIADVNLVFGELIRYIENCSSYPEVYL